MPYDQFARELLSSSGSTLDSSDGQFLSHRDRYARQRRVDLASVPRRAAAVRQVPQPSVRALDAGQLLRDGGVLQSRAAEEIARGDEMLIYLAQSGEVTQPRTGKQMKPWLPGKGEIDAAAGRATAGSRSSIG